MDVEQASSCIVHIYLLLVEKASRIDFVYKIAVKSASPEMLTFLSFRSGNAERR